MEDAGRMPMGVLPNRLPSSMDSCEPCGDRCLADELLLLRKRREINFAIASRCVRVRVFNRRSRIRIRTIASERISREDRRVSPAGLYELNQQSAGACALHYICPTICSELKARQRRSLFSANGLLVPFSLSPPPRLLLD